MIIVSKAWLDLIVTKGQVVYIIWYSIYLYTI